jgi:hypothetical protein
LQESQQSQFELKFIQPFSSFTDGKPTDVPFLADGLFSLGGLSIIAGKPKQGKSSLSRYLAACVTSGSPFLGRDTLQAEAILVSLEDSAAHVDNSLRALGYDPRTDSPIHILEKVSPSLDDTIDALGNALSKMPDVKLVVLDTLLKVIRVPDVNDYMPVLSATEKIHDLARKTGVHIQGVCHCKKAVPLDPFDSLLGSTATRSNRELCFLLFNVFLFLLYCIPGCLSRNLNAPASRWCFAGRLVYPKAALNKKRTNLAQIQMTGTLSKN